MRRFYFILPLIALLSFSACGDDQPEVLGYESAPTYPPPSMFPMPPVETETLHAVMAETSTVDSKVCVPLDGGDKRYKVEVSDDMRYTIKDKALPDVMPRRFFISYRFASHQ